MAKEVVYYKPDIFTVEGFLSDKECDEYISQGNRIGYEEAAVNIYGEQVIVKDIRNNDRILHDDVELAELMFERCKPYLPSYIGDWVLHGLNERFRFYRYEPGQYFNWHRDGSFRRSQTEASKITFLVYLNDNFEGGDTQFEGIRLKPKKGMALFFKHRYLHQGDTLLNGIKYVLRTDVMYKECRTGI